MKKTSKIFGTVALSAALAMGTTMPAFADVIDLGNDADTLLALGDDNTYAQGEGAHTNVNIATYSSNYSVTVPLFAPFLLDTAGGEGLAPTNYRIANDGETALYVTDVAWTMNEDYQADWTFGPAAMANNSNPNAVQVSIGWTKLSGSGASTKWSATATPTDPAYGSFVIELTPDEWITDTDTPEGGYYQETFDSETGINEAVSTIVPAVDRSTPEDATNSTAPTTPTRSVEVSANKGVKWILHSGDTHIGLKVTGSRLAQSLTNIQTGVASIMYTVDSRAPQDPIQP